MPRRMLLMPFVVPLAAAAVGCDDGSQADNVPPPQEWAAVCVDPRDPANPDDDVRLQDDACGDYSDDDHDGTHVSYFFLWSNVSSPQAVPAVGGPMRGYSGQRNYPIGSYTLTKLPPTGAPNMATGKAEAVKANPNIVRGGLGVPAGSVGKGGSKAGSSGG